MPYRKPGAPPGQRDGMTSEQYGELARQQILDFIEENTTEKGSPKLQEIADGLGKSRVNIHRQLVKLIESGRLTRTTGRRSFAVVHNPKEEPSSTNRPE